MPVIGRPTGRGATRKKKKDSRIMWRFFGSQREQASRMQGPLTKYSFNWRTLKQVTLASVVVSLFLFAHGKLADPNAFPIHTVKVAGNYQHVQKNVLKQTIMPYAQAGFFQADVADLKSQLEQIPWVANAVVRRTWPNSLLISFVPQQPIAIWNGRALCNVQHDLFYPSKDDLNVSLPRLRGPEGEHKDVLARYQEMQQLLTSNGLEIVALEMDARHAFRLSLNNGMQLLVGKTDYKERLARFAKVYTHIFESTERRASSVDLRYSHGMAIRWLEL